MRVRALLIGTIVPLLWVADPAAASEAQAAVAYPSPPCAGGPFPNYPEVGQAPIIRVWRDGEVRGWRPAECTGFESLDVNSVIATAGRFRVAGGIDALAERVARVSALTSIRFFSVRDEEWQPLFLAAYTLDSGRAHLNGLAAAPDTSGAELQSGRTLRYWLEENSLLKPAVYRLTVRARTPDRLVYSIVNESEVRALFLRAIEPGEFRQLYVLEREPNSVSGDVWRYYSLVAARTRTGPFKLSTGSFMNRAAAYYRYVAGIPTDLDPPPAVR